MSFAETLETTPSRDVAAEADRPQPGSPALIVALECQRPTVPGFRLLLDGLDEVVVARSGATGIERAGRAATIFVGDPQTSRRHLTLRRTPSGWWLQDLGSKNGTMVNGEPVTGAALTGGDLVEAGGTLLLFVDEGGPRRGGRARVPARAGGAVSALQTMSASLQHCFDQVLRVAASNVPLLVRGETGTGKELMARAIHEASGRGGSFVPVNCGALPRDLLESELFGHRRGAFTGASGDRDGLIRRAHRGTLFLDEVAELPPDSQVALLRVLQDGEVRPVGACEEVTVDVRIVAATHQDLRERIASGRFREDLYARIAGFEIAMPPLRERREDLGMLIATLLSRRCLEPARVTLSKAAARALFRYAWPLNIRELEQTLHAAVGLSEGGEIDLEHLPPAVTAGAGWTAASGGRGAAPGELAIPRKGRTRRDGLMELLRRTDGNVAAVARAMGCAPIQIRRWCRRLEIDISGFRQPRP